MLVCFQLLENSKAVRLYHWKIIIYVLTANSSRTATVVSAGKDALVAATSHLRAATAAAAATVFYFSNPAKDPALAALPPVAALSRVLNSRP